MIALVMVMIPTVQATDNDDITMAFCNDVTIPLIYDGYGYLRNPLPGQFGDDHHDTTGQIFPIDGVAYMIFTDPLTSEDTLMSVPLWSHNYDHLVNCPSVIALVNLPPIPTNSTYDTRTGSLAIMFSEDLLETAYRPHLISVHDNGTSTITFTYGENITIDDDTMTIILSSTDRKTVNTMDDPTVDIGVGAVWDDTSNGGLAFDNLDVMVTESEPPRVTVSSYTSGYTFSSSRSSSSSSSSSGTTSTTPTDGNPPPRPEPITPVPDDNNAPNINIGPAQAVDEGEKVMMNAKATDLDGDNLYYQWTANLFGLVIHNDRTLTPHFTVEEINIEKTVVMNLTVWDVYGVKASDTVDITVTPLPDPPNTTPTTLTLSGDENVEAIQGPWANDDVVCGAGTLGQPSISPAADYDTTANTFELDQVTTYTVVYGPTVCGNAFVASPIITISITVSDAPPTMDCSVYDTRQGCFVNDYPTNNIFVSDTDGDGIVSYTDSASQTVTTTCTATSNANEFSCTDGTNTFTVTRTP